MDPSVVAELVGHEHQNTTDKYYNKIEIKQMLDELEKFNLHFNEIRCKNICADR